MLKKRSRRNNNLEISFGLLRTMKKSREISTSIAITSVYPRVVNRGRRLVVRADNSQLFVANRVHNESASRYSCHYRYWRENETMPPPKLSPLPVLTALSREWKQRLCVRTIPRTSHAARQPLWYESLGKYSTRNKVNTRKRFSFFLFSSKINFEYGRIAVVHFTLCFVEHEWYDYA